MTDQADLDISRSAWRRNMTIITVTLIECASLGGPTYMEALRRELEATAIKMRELVAIDGISS